MKCLSDARRTKQQPVITTRRRFGISRDSIDAVFLLIHDESGFPPFRDRHPRVVSINAGLIFLRRTSGARDSTIACGIRRRQHALRKPAGHVRQRDAKKVIPDRGILVFGIHLRVPTLNSLSLAQWIEEFQKLREQNRKLMQSVQKPAEKSAKPASKAPSTKAAPRGNVNDAEVRPLELTPSDSVSRHATNQLELS